MRLVTYTRDRGARHGALVDHGGLCFVVDLLDALARDEARAGRPAGREHVAERFGGSLLELLERGAHALDASRAAIERAVATGDLVCRADEVTLLAPLPRPPSMRDGYAFRQHVETARRNRGLEMIPEFDRFPVFYFTNHQAVTGPGDVRVRAQHLDRLDFELEAAIVIGRACRDVRAADADAYVAGMTIMNDWSARALQMDEMKLSLGPAKGKDFATSLGPWLVTLDELEGRASHGPRGTTWDLAMTARVDGVELSRGNLADMTWTFAEIVERASYGVTLHPGDVIGSGTCGTGCLLELNGSKTTHDRWLAPGETVELSIDGLGTLVNRVVLDEPRP